MSNYSLPLSIIKISGKDATTFLQGQLTQDMASLDKQWKYSAQCNPKGRVIAFFITFKHQDSFYLITDHNSCEQAIMQLQKYVMRSNVILSRLEELVYFIENESNDTEFKVQINENNISLSTQIGDLIIGSEALVNEHSFSSINAWQQANIKNSVPFLRSKALEKFTPEAINLDLLGAVSFSKGCYTGQEIVARMHYLGKAKRRLFFTNIIGNIDDISVGDNITDQEGKTIGHLVDFEKEGNALISIKVTAEPAFNKNKKTIQSVNNELLL